MPAGRTKVSLVPGYGHVHPSHGLAREHKSGRTITWPRRKKIEAPSAFALLSTISSVPCLVVDGSRRADPQQSSRRALIGLPSETCQGPETLAGVLFQAPEGNPWFWPPWRFCACASLPHSDGGGVRPSQWRSSSHTVHSSQKR